MKDNVIKLNKDDILRLEIVTSDGEKTGNYLEFDLEDIDLFLRYQDLIENHKKNKRNLENQLIIIGKRQDVKGKKLLSKNQEDNIKAIKEFFKKEAEAYNLFLGENGVEKLLNGRNFTWTTLKEIDNLIEEQILPHLDFSMNNIKNKIKNLYGNSNKEDSEVLKADE